MCLSVFPFLCSSLHLSVLLSTKFYVSMFIRLSIWSSPHPQFICSFLYQYVCFLFYQSVWNWLAGRQAGRQWDSTLNASEWNEMVLNLRIDSCLFSANHTNWNSILEEHNLNYFLKPKEAVIKRSTKMYFSAQNNGNNSCCPSCKTFSSLLIIVQRI